MEILSLIGCYKSSALSKELGISSQQIKNMMNEVANKEFEMVKQTHFARAQVSDQPSTGADNVVQFTTKPSTVHSHDIEITQADRATLRVSAVPQDEVKAIITAFIS